MMIKSVLLLRPQYGGYGLELMWLKGLQIHREGAPARIHSNGTQEYLLENKLNRDDGPAVIRITGIKECWKNGRFIKITR